MNMDFFPGLRSYRLQDQLTLLRVDANRLAIANGALKNAAGDTVLDLLLDDALEGRAPNCGS